MLFGADVWPIVNVAVSVLLVPEVVQPAATARTATSAAAVDRRMGERWECERV